MKVNALFISDVHIGSRGSNAKMLLEALNSYEPNELFIVGDFIDGWLLKKRHYWNSDFDKVIKKILRMAKRGVKVTYITGNHDEFFRPFTPLTILNNIQICNEGYYQTPDTKYWISHGDLYDGVVKLKWLGLLGSVGYELAIRIDRFIKRLGYKKSFSKYLKVKVKNAVKFITNFESQLAFQANRRECGGVICGHIHTPSNKVINEIHYLNCGDWIENNSYIIHTTNNEWQIRECHELKNKS